MGPILIQTLIDSDLPELAWCLTSGVSWIFGVTIGKSDISAKSKVFYTQPMALVEGDVDSMKKILKLLIIWVCSTIERFLFTVYSTDQPIVY